jgi:NitT/TauT family transport system substrate-binding protein
MKEHHAVRSSRREFMGSIGLTAAAGLLGVPLPESAAESPPETTTLRIGHSPSLCAAPQFVAEDLLRGEGFTSVTYVKSADAGTAQWRDLATGEVHFNTAFSGPLLLRIDAQDPIVLLAGIHVGCFELFGTQRIRAVRDLKGKTVAIWAPQSVGHVFISAMAAHFGLDPRKDIAWAVHSPEESKRLLAEGKVDAYMAFPPDPQELRANGIGHVVVSSAMDKPWSQYFCCTMVANREFVRKHPVATKRVLRAFLKATDLCASEPERAARLLVDRGYVSRYDYALQTLRDVPWNRWRDYNPEDTVRFYALRLREIGMIKSSPQKIIAEGTDWRFLNELKGELKG